MRSIRLLVTLTLVHLALSAHASPAQTLYGVTGAGDGSEENDIPSSLYRVDPASGTTILIGPTGFSNVTGIDFDPTTGKLYGVVSSPSGGNGFKQLILIDKTTGAGTLIGDTGFQIPDITIGPDGVLRGWTEDGDDPITIDKLTAAVTVTPSSLGTSQTGVAVQDAGHLYVKLGAHLDSVDVVTGASVQLWTFTSEMDNILENEPGGTLISGKRDKTGTQLYRLDPATGTQTALGRSDQRLSALAFDVGVVPALQTPALNPFMLGMLALGALLAGVYLLRSPPLPR